jgi:hypothetical protein
MAGKTLPTYRQDLPATGDACTGAAPRRQWKYQHFQVLTEVAGGGTQLAKRVPSDLLGSRR